MHRFVGHSSILAIGGGTFLYCYHQKRQLFSTVSAEASQKLPAGSPGSEESEGYANVPVLSGERISDEPLTLTLCQVQVVFRHGARTPLHVIPKMEEAVFDPQFITREHQSTVFPYQKVSSVTSKPIEWSNYEKTITNKLLRGGACYGALSAYGKDQMLILGRNLRICYRDKLALCKYDPNDVIAKSSNIRRTVESAKCVLAGLFTKTHLQEYAVIYGPVKIFIPDEKYNILVPDTRNCKVLEKVNHSALIHPDFIPGMKEDRLKLEEYLSKPYRQKLQSVKDVDRKITAVIESQSYPETSKALNQFQQLYEHDAALHTLFQERNAAILKVDHFWYSAMLRQPLLKDVFTNDDFMALFYLRGMEYEEFNGTLSSGYRIHFYFSSNPYFYNKHLCKEVYTRGIGGTSKSIPILWKANGPMYQDKETKAQLSGFFDWYTQSKGKKDDIGSALREVYHHPIFYLEKPSSCRDRVDLPLNFVFCKDDITSRVAHGWQFPGIMERYKDMVHNNATQLLYYAMTGQHDLERQTVTRLSAGPLLTEMVNSAQGFMVGTTKHKLLLFSSHDSTLTALLQALGIWDGKWPPFAADLRLELFKELDRDQYYVRVLYLGKVQKIRGQTEDYVYWPAFKKAISEYMITADEHAKLCASNILEKIAKDILKHDEKELETKDIREESETPAGM